MPRQAPASPLVGGIDPPRPRAATPPHDPPRPRGRVPASALSDDTEWHWWAATKELPLPWEARDTVRMRRPTGLRLPAPDDPPPATGRMVGVCTWAALLGLIGLAVAGRLMVAMLAGNSPSWYEPTVITGGLVGIGLTATAFLGVHCPRLPWALLTAATVPLAVNIVGTALAF